ncbi:nuclear pore protein 84/107 [Kalaharituber pfeilii]|nr:nuclear pore protein 84/107 [Kalaharituber pfeilii]
MYIMAPRLLTLKAQSMSERGWEMGDETELVDEDINGAGMVVSEDITLDDLEQPAAALGDMSILGSEVESFAEYLDRMRTNIINRPEDKDFAENASYSIIESFTEIAKKRFEDHTIALRDLEESHDRREVDGVLFARDASGQYLAFSNIEQNIKYWERERQTWELFSLLLKHRLNKDERPDPSNLPVEFNQYTSNHKFREYLLLSDPQFKEFNLIFDWVKRHGPLPHSLSTLKSGGWIYTKDAIKLKKRGQNIGTLKTQKSLNSAMSLPGESDKDSELVTELDPDAPARQDRYLEAEDVASDVRLMKIVFQYLRIGDLNGAVDACKQAGQYWRGQSLLGGDDAWDASVDGPLDEPNVVVGNRRRELWRRMCYKLATEAAGGWESAVYGVLSGDLATVLSVCRTWEDHLFAHLNTLIESQYYNYLAAHQRIPALAQKFPIFDALQHHGGPNVKLLPKIIDALLNDEHIHAESREAQRIVQGALISERLTEVVEELSKQLETWHNDPEYEPGDIERDLQGLDISDFRLLRVVVHILLILKSLNAGFPSDSGQWEQAENVIAGYIDLLATAGKHELTPLYAGHISKKKAAKVMGQIMVKVTNEETRTRLLGLMKTYGIDVSEALKHMINTVFVLTEPHYFRMPPPTWTGILDNSTTGIYDSSSITEEDRTMIRALEWVLLVPELREDMIGDGCIVYKRFLVTGKLAAARELHDKVPSTVLVRPKERPMSDSFDYMDMHESIESSTTKPLSEEVAMHGVMYIEFEMFIQALIALEKWKLAVQRATENKRDRGYKSDLEHAYEGVQSNTLPCAKTWLNTAYTKEEAERIQTIRNTYIPDLILALHNVYIEAAHLIRRGLLMQTLDLAASVGLNSAEGHEIVKCFIQTGRLREYVDKIAEASRFILDAGQAPGREVTRRGVGGHGSACLDIWNVK